MNWREERGTGEANEGSLGVLGHNALFPPMSDGGRKGVRLSVRSVGREVKLAADRTEQVGMRVTAGEAEQDTPGGDCYSGGDFQKRHTNGRCLSTGQWRCDKDGT